MGWTMLYLFVALKIPIGALAYIVWWAVKQEPDPDEDVRDDGLTNRSARTPVPKSAALGRRAGGARVPQLPPRPRVRTVKARGKKLPR